MTIYSSPTCRACQILKQKLKEQGIAFEEINILKVEPQEQTKIAQKAGRLSLPIIEKDGKFYHSLEEIKC